jgi:hypothetical protein
MGNLSAARRGRRTAPGPPVRMDRTVLPPADTRSGTVIVTRGGLVFARPEWMRRKNPVARRCPLGGSWAAVTVNMASRALRP